MGILSNIISKGLRTASKVAPKRGTVKISDIIKNRAVRPTLKREDIPIKSFTTGSTPKGADAGSPIIDKQEAFYRKRLEILTKDKPYAVEQLNDIQKSIEKFSVKDLNKVSASVNKAIDSLEDDHIKKAWHSVRRLEIAQDIYHSFTDATKGFNKGNALARIKAVFNGAEQSSLNASLIFENRLVVGLREKGTQHTDAFNLLLNNPDKFKSLYGVSQDDLFVELIENSGRLNGVPIVGDIVNILKKADADNINSLQRAGIPIGKVDGFSLGLQIPDSFAHNSTKDEFLQAFQTNTTVHNFEPLEDLYDSLIQRSTLRSGGDNLAFLSRKIEFRSAKHELQFYKTVNNIRDKSYLTQDIISFKKKSIKSAMIQSSLGDNPIETFKEAIEKVKTLKGGDKLTTVDHKDLDKLENWFSKHYEALRGNVNVTNQTVENLGDVVSALTSAVTGALGGSFVRNLLFDFVANYSAVKQAIYNPNTTIGGAAFETFKSFYDVGRTYFNKSEGRKAVAQFLDILHVASISDAIGTSNINTIENTFEAVGLSSKTQSLSARIATALKTTHSKVFSMTGSDQLLDNRRASHLIKLQRLWSNTLDNTANYDEYINSFIDPIDVKQVSFLKTKFGIGRKEFELLKKVGRQKTNGKVLGMTVPDAITPDSILDSVGIASKTELQDLSHKWRVFLHNSILDAAPVTTNADSLSINTGLFNATSGMRLVIRPLLKFADVSQSQFNGVIERVALNSYGDRAIKYGIGSGKSHYLYSKALLYYTGGSIGIAWAKDALQGRKYTDFTNLDNVISSAVFSGFGGYPLQVLYSIFGSNRGGSGFYGNLPISKGTRDIGKIYNGIAEGLLEGDNTKLYKGVYALAGFTGITSLWYLKGVMDTAFKHALMSKHERNDYDKVRDAYRFPNKNKQSGGFRN